jgi:hypothetical protein
MLKEPFLTFPKVLTQELCHALLGELDGGKWWIGRRKDEDTIS